MSNKQSGKGYFSNKSDRELLQAVIDWKRLHDYWPTIVQIKHDETLPNLTLCNARFGNRDGTIQAAKIQCGQLSTDEAAKVKQFQPQVLTMLQTAADFLAPRRVTSHSLMSTPPQIAPTILDLARYCGGLDAGLRMLGLPLAHPAESDLILALQQAAITLGRTPVQNDCGTEYLPYQRSTYTRAFGSWQAALRIAGLEMRNGRPRGIYEPDGRQFYAGRPTQRNLAYNRLIAVT